jgi:hypothetical protein
MEHTQGKWVVEEIETIDGSQQTIYPRKKMIMSNYILTLIF